MKKSTLIIISVATLGLGYIAYRAASSSSTTPPTTEEDGIIISGQVVDQSIADESNGCTKGFHYNPIAGSCIPAPYETGDNAYQIIKTIDNYTAQGIKLTYNIATRYRGVYKIWQYEVKTLVQFKGKSHTLKNNTGYNYTDTLDSAMMTDKIPSLIINNFSTESFSSLRNKVWIPKGQIVTPTLGVIYFFKDSQNPYWYSNWAFYDSNLKEVHKFGDAGEVTKWLRDYAGMSYAEMNNEVFQNLAQSWGVF